MNQTTLYKGLILGITGGLAGTIVMDLFGAGIFLVMGGPASLSFTLIGDAAAAFLSMLGIDVAGGTPLGALLHYLIGLALGAIWGAAVSRIATLRGYSPRKKLGLGVLFVELMSLPMLIAAALVLKMTTSETAQYFGVSFVMHLVYGLVLGAFVRKVT